MDQPRQILELTEEDMLFVPQAMEVDQEVPEKLKQRFPSPLRTPGHKKMTSAIASNYKMNHRVTANHRSGSSLRVKIKAEPGTEDDIGFTSRLPPAPNAASPDPGDAAANNTHSDEIPGQYLMAVLQEAPFLQLDYLIEEQNMLLLTRRSQNGLDERQTARLQELQRKISSREEKLRRQPGVTTKVSQARHGDKREKYEPIVEERASKTQVKSSGQLEMNAGDYWRNQYTQLTKDIRGYNSTGSKRANTDARPQGLTEVGSYLQAQGKPMGGRKDISRLFASGRRSKAAPDAENSAPSPNKAEALKQLVLSLTARSRKTHLPVLDIASKSFGHGKCKMDPVDGTWRLPGMKTGLMDHQLVGVRWMLSREFSPDGPYGGILADEMGLGKTHQILALLTQNPRSQPDIGQVHSGGGTLIVCPANAVAQWLHMIHAHAHFTLFTRLNPREHSEESAFGLVKTFDIIVASYNQIEAMAPKDEKDWSLLDRIREKTATPAEIEEGRKVLGLVFRMPFERIVLDEAHHIKTLKSKTSKACNELQAKYRWCVTGTPLPNSIDELFPYLKFIGANWTPATLKEFRKDYCNTADETTKRKLSAIMPSIMLRRLVDKEFVNSPIIGKRPYVNHKVVELFADERVIYDFLQAKYRAYLKSERIEQSHIAPSGVMRAAGKHILRLRQCTGHAFLAEPAFNGDLNRKELTALRKSLQDLKYDPRDSKFKLVEAGEIMEQQGPTVRRNTPANGNSLISQLSDVEVRRPDECVLCDMQLTDGKKTSQCGHNYCLQCAEAMVVDAKRSVDPERADKPCCAGLGCGREFAHEDVIFPGADGSEQDVTERSRSRRTAKTRSVDIKSQRQAATVQAASNDRYTPQASSFGWRGGAVSRPRRVGDDVNGMQPRLKLENTFLQKCDQNLKNGIPPSAKTMAVFQQVMSWLEEAPDDKIIVYTEFVQLAGIIGRVLQNADISFVYFNGSIKPMQARLQAIKDFQTKPEIKVFVASIKCAGVALNLECANRVILVDQWWNRALEEQAFSRVLRIGQKKDVHIVKILAKDTIDDGIYKLQEIKASMTASVLDHARESEEMTLEDIRALFNL